MGCSSEEKNANYDFFNNIDTYIEEVKKIENSMQAYTSIDDCNNFSSQHNSLGNVERAKSLCNRFGILQKHLVAIKSQVSDPCNFLNYWLNSELNQPWFSENNITSHIYNGMESQLDSKDDYTSLDCILCNISKDELYKMNKLYNLYKNYSKLNTILDSKSEENKQEILTLSLQCCTDYNDVSYMCNSDNKDNNTKFCEQLNTFISKYDKLDEKVVGPEYDFSDYFIKLSECPNTKIITTAVTGTFVGLIPLFGVLYKVSELNIKL
ncbi:hypothetical protein PVNG_05973 [Plasmodium vivax North Korean]|uniref:PIR Superfamily Protein n=1 Tax=Plasmodium vivax North Korean TaxID=1035514 RepID=A0A0J9U370_PLAVI|nr:hypothetical protein PVNG_05973 [Plasmodium vivax North Korean]